MANKSKIGDYCKLRDQHTKLSIPKNKSKLPYQVACNISFLTYFQTEWLKLQMEF